MQVHPCTFYRQEETANRRTRSAPRRGLPERKRPRPGAARAAAIRRIRRDHHARIPGSAAVLCRRSNDARARQVRRAWLCRDAFVRSRSPRCIGRGHLTLCRCFRNALLTAARQSATTTRGCGGANAGTRTESTMPLARTRQIERLGSTVARRVRAWGRAKISRSEAPGCGTGLIHCGGQTDRRFAAEMR
jgi:hypothetical protein